MSHYPFHRLDTIIIAMGITAVISLGITGFLGLTGINYTLHKYTGIATLSLAGLHGALGLYKWWRLKQWKPGETP